MVKNPPAMWDLGSILGLERSPGEGHGYLLQYSCLENSMDRGAQQATVHGGGKESDTEQLSLSQFTAFTKLYSFLLNNSVIHTVQSFYILFHHGLS